MRVVKKTVYPGEKKEIVNCYIFQGIKRDTAQSIIGEYYYQPKAGKRGRPPLFTTLKLEGDDIINVHNHEITEQVREIEAAPDTGYGYNKMTYALLIMGFLINHKKLFD